MAALLEVLPVIAGKRLPVVLYGEATALSSQGSSLGPSHEVLHLVASLGWAVLIPRNLQEVLDLALIARRAAEDSETPFLVALDPGFSRQAEAVYEPDPRLANIFVGAPELRRRVIFDPERPLQSGSVQTEGGYLEGRIAQRYFAGRCQEALTAAFTEFAELTGRQYSPVITSGDPASPLALVSAGPVPVCPGIRSVSILSLRPFPDDALKSALRGCRAVTVLDAAEDSLGGEGPLARQVRRVAGTVKWFTGVAGLGIAVTGEQVEAAVENMKHEGKSRFVLGVKHPDALEVLRAAPERESVRLLAPGGTDLREAVFAIGALLLERFQIEVRAVLPADGEHCGLPVSARLHLPDVPGFVLATPQAARSLSDQGAWILPSDTPSVDDWLGGFLKAAHLGEAPEPSRPAFAETRYSTAPAPPIQIAATEIESSLPVHLVPGGFQEQVVEAYLKGREAALPAGMFAARALVPPASSLGRSYRKIAASLPALDPARCTGCLDCLCLCPDAAILARVVEPGVVPEQIERAFVAVPEYGRARLALSFDADRCKGCGECATACSPHAIAMVPRTPLSLEIADAAVAVHHQLPPTPARFIDPSTLGGMLLADVPEPFPGGGTSCTGCSESTAVRLLLAATSFHHNRSIGVVAGGGCVADFAGTYPFNASRVAWTRSLEHNALAEALGIRRAWDAAGHADRKLWVVASTESLAGSGFGSLVEWLDSGIDINVLALQKEPHGLATSLLLHSSALIAQTTPAHLNHFYRCLIDANGYRGPSLLVCYAACVGEHQIAPDQAAVESRRAVDARVFPLFECHPERGDRLRKRLSLHGNPAPLEDWFAPLGVPFDPVEFARGERRFAERSDSELTAWRDERLANWRRLQELAGLR